MYSNDPRISTYEYKGLKGRKLHQPAKNTKSRRVFFMVYGQHASLERCLPVVEALAEFGEVYLVDTPGFGGMDSPYKVGEKAVLDFYAGHLKNIFDTVLPKNKKITVFGISFGLQPVTQFFSKYPEYNDRVEELVSFVGLLSYRNMRISKKLEVLLKFLTSTGKTKTGAAFYKHLIFREQFVRPYYLATSKNNPKFEGLSKAEIKEHAYDQAWLWAINDSRTHAKTANDFLFYTDLTNLRVDLPITHIGVPNDHFLDDKEVVKDLKTIYKKVTNYELDLPGHAPLSAEDPEKILKLIPASLSKKWKVSHNK